MTTFETFTQAAKAGDARLILTLLGEADAALRQQVLTALSLAWRMVQYDPHEERRINDRTPLGTPEDWEKMLGGERWDIERIQGIIKALILHEDLYVDITYSTEEYLKALSFMPRLEYVRLVWKDPNLDVLFPYLPHVISLDESEFCVPVIGDAIAHMAKVEDLSINDLQLTKISPEIGKLTRLKDLDIQNNFLKELPDEIGNCVALRSINLSNNLLTTWPDSLLSLPRLYSLVIGNNPFAGGLPDWIANLAKLELLDIRDTHTTDLRPLAALAALKILSIENNPIQHYPAAPLPGLQYLNISSDQLADTVEWLQGITSLIELRVDAGELPVDIGLLTSFTQLRTLKIFDVPVQGLEKIVVLKHLENLRLKNNQLTEVPPEIRLLTQLKDLSITHQPLASLPNVFGGFQQLLSVDLGDNQLPSLPDSLLLNWSIRILNAYGNPFSPERLADMQLKGRRI